MSNDLVVDVGMAQRFWARVKKSGPDECWVWSGYRNAARNGYGVLMDSRTRRPVWAHRVSFALHNPDVAPAGVVVMHSCDNPPCCNPRHLLAGTTALNTQDAWIKGRLALPKNSPKGETHHSAALTEELAWRIKYGDLKGQSLGTLSKQFGLTKSALSRLRLGKSWKNLSSEPPEKFATHGE